MASSITSGVGLTGEREGGGTIRWHPAAAIHAATATMPPLRIENMIDILFHRPTIEIGGLPAADVRLIHVRRIPERILKRFVLPIIHVGRAGGRPGVVG